MKLDKKPENQVSAAINTFSKVADMKIPDSPPPEKNDDPEEPGMNKFERMMKAACSIKSSQLESKRRKFEKLPMFLKASVYYTTKQELVRKLEFYPKYFAFDLLKQEANQEFQMKNYDRACRKYEEALSIFRYFNCSNPKWNEEGIDDKDLTEFEDFGKKDNEKQIIHRAKLQMYLNISACNIKTKDFEQAYQAANEAIKLDPNNIKALYRRARSLALPINSGVEEFKATQKDLKLILQLQPQFQPAITEMKKLEKLIDINRKREKDTYGKMFNTTKSISEYVEEKTSKQPINYKTLEDREYEKEKKKMDEKIKKMLDQKIQEFSFEVSKEKKHFKELDDIQEMIDKAEESYKLFKKAGRIKEAKMIKKKLEETRYAKEHLLHVMNLDFTKPTEKMRKLAIEHNIDLTDPIVIKEFKKIQKQNLDDIRKLKEGKLFNSEGIQEEEKETERSTDRGDKREQKEKKVEIKKDEQKEEKGIQDLLKGLQEDKKDKNELTFETLKQEQMKHYMILGCFVAVWLAFILYQNMSFE